MNGFRPLASAMAAALLSACASKPVPAPAPERAPPVHRAPPVVVAPPPVGSDAEAWRDQPLTPGDWSYDPGAGEARYADFSLRCDGARRQVIFSRAGASGPLRLRTTYGAQMLPAAASLPAADPMLDEMAFSRGRFTVEAEGLPTLILPAWPEPARVVEDCRG